MVIQLYISQLMDYLLISIAKLQHQNYARLWEDMILIKAYIPFKELDWHKFGLVFIKLQPLLV